MDRQHASCPWHDKCLALRNVLTIDPCGDQATVIQGCWEGGQVVSSDIKDACTPELQHLSDLRWTEARFENDCPEHRIDYLIGLNFQEEGH